MERFHVQPQTIDSKFWKNVYSSFLVELDPYQIVFTNEDYTQLISISSNNDASAPITFFNETVRIFHLGLQNQVQIKADLLSKKIDFKKQDIFEIPQQDLNLANDQLAIDNRYKQYLKYKILKRMEMLTVTDTLSKLTIDSLLQHELEARIQIKEQGDKLSNKLISDLEGLKNSLFETFLNSVAIEFDPHSNYFSPFKKNKFERAISKEIYLFGFSLDKEENDEVKIVHLSPGGAAWKSNALHVGDVILEVYDHERKKRIHPTKMSYEKLSDELDKMIDGVVTLKVRKTNGQEKSVDIVKEKVEVEENSVRSFILEGEKRIGYIVLPSFYTDVLDQNGLGCANDVAKELYKLQQEGIDGLILDLRFNGGGSLQEAVDLTGIFIDAGPILIQKNKFDKPNTFKDRNRGSAYTGPLMVMINPYSASASEVVAGALQDYNRAIIVGQNSFGKATYQSVLPLDTTVLFGKAKYGEELGYTKITFGRLYRLLGSTNQFNGVKPDVIYPELFQNSEEGERYYRTALKPDSVVKKIYYSPLNKLDTKQVSLMSRERIQKNITFQKLYEINKQYIEKSNQFEKEINLNVEAYLQMLKDFEELFDEFDKISTLKSTKFKIQNPKYNADIIQSSETRLLQNKNLVAAFETDLLLEESYSIFLDFLTK